MESREERVAYRNEQVLKGLAKKAKPRAEKPKAEKPKSKAEEPEK